jgi:hypothetical protein
MKWVKTRLRINGRIHNIEIAAVGAHTGKKMQFSQKICVFGVILVTAAWLVNFILLWFGREPMSDVTIAIVSMFGGFSTGGYFALAGVRDCSRNKHKITEKIIEVKEVREEE